MSTTTTTTHFLSAAAASSRLYLLSSVAARRSLDRQRRAAERRSLTVQPQDVCVSRDVFKPKWAQPLGRQERRKACELARPVPKPEVPSSDGLAQALSSLQGLTTRVNAGLAAVKCSSTGRTLNLRANNLRKTLRKAVKPMETYGSHIAAYGLSIGNSQLEWDWKAMWEVRCLLLSMDRLSSGDLSLSVSRLMKGLQPFIRFIESSDRMDETVELFENLDCPITDALREFSISETFASAYGPSTMVATEATVPEVTMEDAPALTCSYVEVAI